MRTQYAYRATWLNGIQGHDGTMLRCTVREIDGDDIDQVFDALKNGPGYSCGVCVDIKAMAQILDAFQMVIDWNQSGQGFKVFRHISRMEV